MEGQLLELATFIFRITLASAVSCLIYLISNEFVRYRARNPHFCGPKGWPIFGNLLDLQENTPEKLRQWSKPYGDVYQVQFGNQPILVVNSAAAAAQILLHSGAAVNSRPTPYTFTKIASKSSGATIGTSRMSPALKVRRRAAAAALNKPAVASYASHLDLETLTLVQDLHQDGNKGQCSINPMPLVYRFALSVIVTVNWGRRVTAADKSLFQEIIDVEYGITTLRRVTENWQDYIPILRLNPFSSNSKAAKDWRKRREGYLGRLDDELQARIDDGTAKPCIQSNVMTDPESKLNQQDLRTISISMLQGGTGTISGTLSWALLYLSQHPEIQHKAFAEINGVFPTISAVLAESTAEISSVADKLPYLHALGQECLRYFTVLRLSLPRVTTKPISYESKPIATGSTIFLNAWACNMDAELWDDPEAFRPERWIEQPDAPLFTYGLGYRMCAGWALANRELELVLLRVLGCFEILPKTGVKADASPWTGSASVKEAGHSPRPYEVFFRPREEAVLCDALEQRLSG